MTPLMSINKQYGSFGDYSVLPTGRHRFSLPSSAEMAALDSATISSGRSALELMERAGEGIAKCVLSLYPALRRVVILCGSGNNGGDGLVIARLLAGRGIVVYSVLVAANRYSAECREQLKRTNQVRIFGEATPNVLGADIGLKPITALDLKELIERSDLVVDALLGTGQRNAPRGLVAELIEIVASVKRSENSFKILSVDIPTGIDCDTGNLFTPHIVADHTVTLQCIKRGMLQFPARGGCGAISTVDIGIGGDPAVEFELVAPGNLPKVAQRAPDTHKGALGRVLVIGGSLSMPGAPMLAALGALRCGAGIVSRLIRGCWQTVVPLPEAMYRVLGGDAPSFQLDDLDITLKAAKDYDILVIGPGLGTDNGTRLFVSALIEELKRQGIRMVLDADALNLIASQGIDLLKGSKAIMTPHPGEASRLLGVSTEEVQRDRFSAVRSLAERSGCIAVLKGAGSLIHNGQSGG